MSKKILIVDDSKVIRQQITFTLKKAGFQTVEACDGLEGLEALNGNPDVGTIITDLNMPNMDGMQFIVAIRQQEQFKKVPILMLTTESKGEMVSQAKTAGANGWLVKPFNPEQLVGIMNKLMP